MPIFFPADQESLVSVSFFSVNFLDYEEYTAITDQPWSLVQMISGKVTGSLINIDVQDLAKAEAFYCGVFDLEVVRRFGSDGVELTGLGVPLFLLQKAEGSPAFPGGQRKRDYSRHWTPIHLDITVTNIESIHQRAVDAGAKAEAEIKTVPYGKIVLMSDPFGHGFCLIEFNKQGYDAIAPARRKFDE